jgi:hypothetical protein
MNPLLVPGGNGHEAETPDAGLRSLQTARLSELKTFYIALRSPFLQTQAEEDDVFADIVKLAIDDYGVGQGELSGILQTTTSTVGRWKQGSSVPSVYARSGVLAAIASAISQKIADREAELSNEVKRRS